MLKHISTQIKIMLNKKGFQVSFTAVMIFCLLETVFCSFGFKALRGLDDGFVGNDSSSVITTFEAFILCESSNLLSYIKLLFPFLCALPFSFSLLTDKETNTDVLFCAYEGKRKYIISKSVAAFVGGFVIFFIPFMIELAFNYLIFDNSMGANIFNPNWNFTGWGVIRATDYANYPFGDILVRSPLAFSIMYSAMFSLMSGVFGFFALACSVFFRGKKSLSFIPGFVILNVLVYAEDYAMNGDIDTKYTELDPFRYVSYYYTNGYYGLNYGLFFASLLFLVIIGAVILTVFVKTDYI